MSQELPLEPRAVRPRTRRYKRHPVVAIDHTLWMNEGGEMGSKADLGNSLHTMDSTLFAMCGIADWITELDQIYRKSHPDSWQYRMTTNERAIIRPHDGQAVAARVTVPVHYFGFKGGQFHKAIDPVTMYGHSLDRVWPGDGSRIRRLLDWAVSIRDFCDDNGMEVRPTIGSISGQFLTDRRFYPGDRRKVTHKINERAREANPGNYYALAVHPSPRHYYTAWYIDQQRAHHYHARTTAMPCANSLFAIGDFKHLQDTVQDYREDVPFYGLLCLDLELPSQYNPMLHWIKPNKHGKYHFVFSNEIPYLLDMGYRIKGVVAAWGSNERDEGIARYANWAHQQLDTHTDAPWLKPLLLATYGTLACRASWGETVFRLATRGEHIQLRTGRHEIDGVLVKAPQKLEPKIVNVIHRGMIEAATRVESLGLCHYLTEEGYRVLQIYADAIIVQCDNERAFLPALPEPWRVKDQLNHLQVVSKQAFISGEMTKLPGVGRELKEYSRSRTGVAPTRPIYNSLSGERVKTERKI